MTTSTFAMLAATIVMLWIICIRGAYVLKRVAEERDDAKHRGDDWKFAAKAWQARALDLENEAQCAWHAYNSALGAKGWNTNDRDAFARLATVLNYYNARGKQEP